jgi:hypothetical protein
MSALSHHHALRLLARVPRTGRDFMAMTAMRD